MKNLTPKQLEKLENQIASLSNKLASICQQHRIGDRNMELVNEGFIDWDAETQEGMVYSLHQADFTLDRLFSLVQTVRENMGE